MTLVLCCWNKRSMNINKKCQLRVSLTTSQMFGTIRVGLCSWYYLKDTCMSRHWNREPVHYCAYIQEPFISSCMCPIYTQFISGCTCTSGWEGVNCEIDINECTQLLLNCTDEHTRCNNTEGRAECVCIDNYFRNTTTELCQGKACFSQSLLVNPLLISWCNYHI